MVPYGSKGARLGGFVVDSLLISAMNVVGSLLGGFVAALMSTPEGPRQIAEDAVRSGMTLGWIFWGAVAWFLNYGILQGLTGRSVGKMLCGSRVVNRDGTPIEVFKSLARTVCYYASVIPLYLGFIAIF